MLARLWHAAPEGAPVLAPRAATQRLLLEVGRAGQEVRSGIPLPQKAQDIEVTDAHVAEFLDWFFQASEIEPVWLCPIRLRSDSAALSQLGLPEHAPWPLYPLEPGTTWVNVGFWSGVPADHVSLAQEPGAFNKVIERKVSELGGHKSLYSEAFYDRPEFERLYGGDLPERMKATYDPDRRFPGLFEKTVNNA